MKQAAGEKWPTLTIAELTKTSAGGTPRKSGKGFYEGGEIPWLLSGEVASRDILKAKNFITPAGLAGSSAKIFPPGSVLVAMYGATAGEVGILRIEAATNQAVCAILPGEGHVPEYVYYYFLHAKQELVALAVGNAQPNISQAKIKSTRLPIPPLDEQKRIVALLDQAFAALDRARAHAEANLADAAEVFNRTVERLLGRDGIETSTLGEVCEIQSGVGFPHKDQGHKSGKYPFYKVSDMNLPGNEWQLRHANNYIDDSTRKRLRAAVMPLNSIVFPKVGGAIATNKKRVIETAGCVDNNVMGLIPHRDKIDPAYLHEWLYAIDIYEFSNKANPPSITQGTVRDWPISVPSKARQGQIVDEIRAMRQATTMLAEAYKNALEDIFHLRQSLLQKAFSGELT